MRHRCAEDIFQKNDFQQLNKPSAADIPREPHKIFELFFNNTALLLLASQTLNYSAQKGNHFFTLTSDEMSIFINSLISRYYSVSRRRMYWSNEFDTSNKLVIKPMPRNRFEGIMKYFHAADNSKICRDEKFAKIGPFMDILNENFNSLGSTFGPMNLSIDESNDPIFWTSSHKAIYSWKANKMGIQRMG